MAALMELLLAEGLWFYGCCGIIYLCEWPLCSQYVFVCLCVSALCLVSSGWWKHQHSISGRQCWRHSMHVDNIFLSSISQMTEKVFLKRPKLCTLATYSSRGTHIYSCKHTHWLFPLSPAWSEGEISLRSITVFLTTLPDNEAFTVTLSASLHLCSHICSFKSCKGWSHRFLLFCLWSVLYYFAVTWGSKWGNKLWLFDNYNLLLIPVSVKPTQHSGL